jgi:MOSC domain-containing protein YiiM
MITPVLVSIQVGRPQSLGSDAAVSAFDKPWTTGIFKHLVEGPVTVGHLGLAGDGQADKSAHGGVDKALCAYSADHYEHWRRVLDLASFTAGAFGENLTIRHLAEDDVCIGDTWTIGGVTVQVSQPRQPCWKLARKWRIKDLADQVIASGRTGWYLRALTAGALTAGEPCVLVERPNPEWTITRANQVMHGKPIDRSESARLAEVPLLSESWRVKLRGRAAGSS